MVYCNSAACSERGRCASHITNVQPGCYDVTPFADDPCDAYEPAVCTVCKKNKIHARGLCANCYHRWIKGAKEPYAQSKQFKEEVIKMLKEGVRQSSIARELNVTKQWVSLIVNEWRLKNGIK